MNQNACHVKIKKITVYHVTVQIDRNLLYVSVKKILLNQIKNLRVEIVDVKSIIKFQHIN